MVDNLFTKVIENKGFYHSFILRCGDLNQTHRNLLTGAVVDEEMVFNIPITKITENPKYKHLSLSEQKCKLNSWIFLSLWALLFLLTIFLRVCLKLK